MAGLHTDFASKAKIYVYRFGESYIADPAPYTRPVPSDRTTRHWRNHFGGSLVDGCREHNTRHQVVDESWHGLVCSIGPNSRTQAVFFIEVVGRHCEGEFDLCCTRSLVSVRDSAVQLRMEILTGRGN